MRADLPRTIERELVALVSSAATPIALFDASLCYLSASRSWYREHGLDGASIVGRTVYDVFPEIPERWRHVHRRALAGETVTSDLDLFAREGGQVQWLRWSVAPWHHANGSVGGIVIAAIDFSELEKRRVEAERAHDEFEMLFENAGTAIVFTDCAGRIERASATFARLVGCAAPDLIGVEFERLLALGARSASKGGHGFCAKFAELRACRITEVAGRARLVTRRRKESDAEAPSERWVRCSAVRLDAGTAAASRIVIFVRDETERVLLERRVREADRISSLGMLGAGLGHELGNALLPMQGHLNALKAAAASGVAPESTAHHIAAIGAGLSYLRELADGMHDLGRDVSGPDHDMARTAEDACTDVVQWLPSVERLLRCALPSATRFEVCAADGCPAARIEPTLLTQSLVNLLVNARDAIGERHGEDGRAGMVRVSFAAEGGGDDACMRISVTDNGAGMSKATLARAREPFFTTKPAGRGTGLGLAMVAAAVAEASGRLLISSTVDGGTEVSMLLPIVSATI